MAEMTFGSMMTIPGDLLGAPMQAELSQKSKGTTPSTTGRQLGDETSPPWRASNYVLPRDCKERNKRIR